MRVVLIGNGRVATNLLPALQQAGHDVVSINSRTLEDLPEKADIYIIAVKDSALHDVICQAAKGRGEQFFVHTAGSLSLDIFEGCCRHYGVFYPMQTFSKEKQVDFSHVPLFIEASDSLALTTVRSLATSLSNSVYVLSSEERKYLHLSAVFACNFANHCYALSAEILEAHGLPFSVMQPLIDETAEKVRTMHPRDAQTGPAVRSDENVIAAQKALLAVRPDIQEIYDIMSKSIQKLAHDKL